MSRLDELIQELCPDGVEYKRIDEICDISRGRVMSKDYIQANQGEYPVYSSQTENDGELGKISSFDYEGEYLTWTTDGANAGSVFYRNGRFSITNVCGLLKVNKDDVITRYIYHSLQIEAPKYVNKGMGNPKLMSNVMARIKLPVPPLEVQREIVRILDNFTSLKAELQAELQARKKQYEYYRDKLLSFASDIPLFQLGKVCDLQAGKAIKASEISDIETNQETIPCYGANGLRGYVGKSNQKGDKSIIGRQGAQCGNVCYATGKYYATEHAVVVTDKGYFNSRYLFHVLTHANLNQYKTAGAQPGLSVSKLNNVMIAVPDKKVQDKIANILDNFEKICSDLNIGLPAEIEARQKQYEYYRDALLSFDNSYFVNVERERERDEWHSGLIKLWQYVFGYAYLTLDKISENCDRQRKPVAKGKRETGKYPYYGASGVVDYVSDYIFDGDYLLVSEDGANLLARTTPIAFLISGKNWVNNHAHVLKFDTYELRRYVEIYLNAIDLGKFISGGAQPKLNQENLNKIVIPVPEEEKIKDIVNILDRFDTLCNDLSAGLPAEIEARQKQYEYYRDKLLSFQVKSYD